jgi:hypothetical protein
MAAIRATRGARRAPAASRPIVESWRETAPIPSVSKQVRRAFAMQAPRVRAAGTVFAQPCTQRAHEASYHARAEQDRGRSATRTLFSNAHVVRRNGSTTTIEIDPMMSLVRLLGFKNLTCGCVTGHYRELGTNREITYVEEKGTACDHQEHRRNHTLATARFRMPAVAAKAS